MAEHVVAGLRCADAADLAASFVLGALEPAEGDAVRAHLAGCPEAHPEFAELGSVVPSLLETVELVAPPAGLRDRILAAAADTPRATGTQRSAGTRPVAAVPATGSTVEPQRLIKIPRRDQSARSAGSSNIFRRPVWAAVALAAALAVVAVGAWNVQLRDEINGLTAYRNGVATVLDQAEQPGAQLAVLAAPDGPGGPAGLAVVTGSGANVSLVMRDLAPTLGTEVYTAWLLADDGAPVPIGSFTVNASGIGTFATSATPVGNAALQVGLTREAGPGATTPTLPMVASGDAS